jgi:hypothetical protein
LATVRILRSTTAGNVPSSLVSGQIAINEGDGKLFYRNSSGVVTQLPTGGGGATEVYEYATPASFPATGAASTLYVDKDRGRVFRWDTTVYVETGPVGGVPVGGSSSASDLTTGTLADARLSGNVVLTTDARLSDAREWSASTVTQADAEAGVATARAAFTVQRVWQAIAAWWAASAAKAKLDGVASGATANQTDAHLLNRANHTGTQPYSTLTGTPTLGTVAALDIPASGNASSAQVVVGSDTRLSDARSPVSHAASHAAAGADALSLSASQIVSGVLAAARLASGTASSATYLRGDQTWASIAGGAAPEDDQAILAGQVFS